MPIPYTPNSIPSRPLRRFSLPTRQSWSNDLIRIQHQEALYNFGEYVMFFLMWDIEDLNQGLVTRCSLCYGGSKIKDEITEVYNQPAQFKCPDCFGTTFQGGWKARIIRPAIIDYSEEAEEMSKRGSYTSQSASIQTTADFHARDNDYFVRADNVRWMINGGGTTNRIRDGFGMPDRVSSSTGFQYSDCRREDSASVAYLLPPVTDTEIISILGPDVRSGKFPWFPEEFTQYEEIRSPILSEILN